MQVPPNSLRSTIATFFPAAVRRRVRCGPAWPVPMMIASNCVAMAAVYWRSPGNNLKDLLHVSVGGGGGLLRAAAVLTRGQEGGVPVPPVVLGVRPLVIAVVLLGFPEELRKGLGIGGLCPCRRPLAAGEPLPDFLEQPPVAVRIPEGGVRAVGTTLRIRPRGARSRVGVKPPAETAAAVVEYLADLNPAREQLAPGGVDIIHRQQKTDYRAGRGRRDPLSEDDRCLRARGGEVHSAVVRVAGIVDVQAKPELLVEALCPIDVGNGHHDHFKFHVHDRFSFSRPVLRSGGSPREPPRTAAATLPC